jgi:hypothetical protein
VGCGRISGKHFHALQQHGDRAELVAVCDTDPEVLRKAAEENGAKAYSSLEELLGDSDADAVILATPSGIHAEQGIQVAEAGKHVISEKPMATRWEDAKRLVRTCDRENVRPLRGQAEPPERDAPAGEARHRQGALRPHLHGQSERLLEPPPGVLRQRPLARHLGVRRRRPDEPGQPLRGPDGLDDRSGGERARLHRHPRPQHPGRGHRRRERAVALRRPRLHERDHAHLSEEPRGLHHHHRGEGDREDRRRGRERDPALGVRRARRGRRRGREGELRHHLRLRLRSPALLRQRDQHPEGRGRGRDRRPRGAALPGAPDRHLPLRARRNPVALPLDY